MTSPSSAIKRSSCRSRHLRYCPSARIHGPAHRQERVDHAGVVGQFHHIAFALQALPILDAVIAQRVALSNDDERGRQSREIFANKGCITKILSICVGVLPVPQR